MNFRGIIIEESLRDKSILKNVHIVKTEIEKVTDKHNTPWLKKWTLHTIEVSEKKIMELSENISNALESEHNWYADFKNETHHFIIFRGKVFVVDRSRKEEYEEVKNYGIKLGIPDYQLDFSPEVE